MYKIIDCEQRSEAWFKARLGKWTASFFDKAITTTGKRSSSSEDIINRLVAELIVGSPDETFQSEAMLRGRELENEALEFLNFTHGYSFIPCGFMDSELGYGCSPDAMDFVNKIGLELKCPMPHTHLEYIAGGELPKKYKAQVQGSMLVTGFSEWAFFSYHPEIKPFLVVVKRDEEFIMELKKILTECCDDVLKKHRLITQYLND